MAQWRKKEKDEIKQAIISNVFFIIFDYLELIFISFLLIQYF